MIRAYEYRFYPTRIQERDLAQWFGHGRWVWNWALEARRKTFARRGETLTSVDLSRMLTRAKRSARRGWLAQVPASCLAQKLCDHDTAYRTAFAAPARLPRLNSRRGRQSARVAVRRAPRGQGSGLARRHRGAARTRSGEAARAVPAERDAEARHHLARRSRTRLGELCGRGGHRGAGAEEAPEHWHRPRRRAPRNAVHRRDRGEPAHAREAPRAARTAAAAPCAPVPGLETGARACALLGHLRAPRTVAASTSIGSALASCTRTKTSRSKT